MRGQKLPGRHPLNQTRESRTKRASHQLRELGGRKPGQALTLFPRYTLQDQDPSEKPPRQDTGKDTPTGFVPRCSPRGGRWKPNGITTGRRPPPTGPQRLQNPTESSRDPQPRTMEEPPSKRSMRVQGQKVPAVGTTWEGSPQAGKTTPGARAIRSKVFQGQECSGAGAVRQEQAPRSLTTRGGPGGDTRTRPPQQPNRTRGHGR